MQGIFDWLTGSSSTPEPTTISASGAQTDAEKIAAGKKAILYFHNAAKIFAAYPFQSSVEDLYTYINNLSPSWLKNYGNSILVTNFSQTKLKEINEAIGVESLGKLPTKSTDLQIFFDAEKEAFTSVSAKIGQTWEGVKVSFEQGKQVVQIAGKAISSFATYKFLALGVAALTAAATIYAAMKRKSSKKRA